nr:unnamed protein product [Meloidogyne enterolobii]
MITNANENPESNHVTNNHDNDDFFDGLDDYLESTMGVNIADNRAKGNFFPHKQMLGEDTYKNVKQY